MLTYSPLFLAFLVLRINPTWKKYYLCVLINIKHPLSSLKDSNLCLPLFLFFFFVFRYIFVLTSAIGPTLIDVLIATLHITKQQVSDLFSTSKSLKKLGFYVDHNAIYVQLLLLQGQLVRAPPKGMGIRVAQSWCTCWRRTVVRCMQGIALRTKSVQLWSLRLLQLRGERSRIVNLGAWSVSNNKDCCRLEENTILPPQQAIIPPFAIYAGNPGIYMRCMFVMCVCALPHSATEYAFCVDCWAVPFPLAGKCIGELPASTQDTMTEATRSFYQHFIKK